MRDRLKLYNDLIVSYKSQLKDYHELNLQDEEYKEWIRLELNDCKTIYKKLLLELEYSN